MACKQKLCKANYMQKNLMIRQHQDTETMGPEHEKPGGLGLLQRVDEPVE